MTRRTRFALLGIALACIIVVIALCLVSRGGASNTSTAVTSSYPASSLSPLEKLARLSVKGRAPKTGYDRALFGTPWSDDVTVEGGHNGCDTRNDILRRDLTGIGFAAGESCTVLSGVLNDPYTAETVLYQTGSANLIDIDHIVPLADAWQKGAQGWDELTRRNFANDPLNLQTTIAEVNRRKGAGDAATWLPANVSYRCTYATRIVDVKTRYRLWVTEDEREALTYLLRRCETTGTATPLSPVPSHSAGTTSTRSTKTYRVPTPPCYRNVNGDCITLPGNFRYPPDGANALCRDDTYSFAEHRRGSCARHGGVYAWLD